MLKTLLARLSFRETLDYASPNWLTGLSRLKLVVVLFSPPICAAQGLIDVATNATQEVIAEPLEKICLTGKASASLLQRCDELLNANNSSDQIINALQQIAPEEYAAQNTLSQISALVENVEARMDVLQKDTSGVKVDINGQNTLSKESYSPLSIFVDGEIHSGDRDETGREPSFEFKTIGLTAGIDYRFSNNFVAGMALGYNDKKTDITSIGKGQINSDGYGLTLYSTFYQTNEFYLDGFFSYERNTYDNKRNIVYDVIGAQVNQTALSTNDSHQSAFGLGLGYHFNQQAFTFTPNIRLDYFEKDTDKFREEFADPSAIETSLGMDIELGKFNSLTTTLGFQMEYTASQTWGVLVPHINLDWVHEFKNERYPMIARFLEDPDGETFFWASDLPDTDYFNLGFGLLAQFTQGKSAFIHYDGTLGLEDAKDHSITLGARFEF